MIIAIANEKGGSGKTNIAVNLTVNLSLLGEDVLLLDADPQRSVEVFMNIRANNQIKTSFSALCKFGDSLVSEIQNLSEKYETIVVDTGGRDSNEMRQALAVADLVVIPVFPSDLDIAVLNKMISLFQQSQAFNSNSKAMIVISKASPNPFLNKKIKDLQEYISEKELESLYLLDSILYEREAYRNALSNGMGVAEFCNKSHNAFKDFDNFTKEIIKYANDVDKE